MSTRLREMSTTTPPEAGSSSSGSSCLVRATADDDTYEVLGEPNGLSILLNNLLDNAIRHTPHGGRVDLVLRRDGDDVGFDVVDTGPGVAESEMTRVRDRFYRGVDTKGAGSGLGLAIASRVADRHHAELALRNNAGGQGLTVSVTGLRRA